MPKVGTASQKFFYLQKVFYPSKVFLPVESRSESCHGQRSQLLLLLFLSKTLRKSSSKGLHFNRIHTKKNTCSAVCMISVEMGEYDSHNRLPCHLVVKISGERKNDKTCKVCMKLICLLFTISPLQMLRGPPWRPHSSRECQ